MIRIITMMMKVADLIIGSVIDEKLNHRSSGLNLIPKISLI